MIRRFKSAGAGAVRLSLILIAAAGVVVGTLHLALPFANLFRTELEDRLSTLLGLRVEVDHLGVGLAGLVPRVSLMGAKLVDPKSGCTQLSLDQLQIKLDLLASLEARAPQIDAVTMVGAHLVVKRLAEGGVAIAGLEGIQGGASAAMAFFLGTGRFLLSKSELRVLLSPGETPGLRLTGVSMRFDNEGARHRIGLRGRIAGEPDSSLHVAADLQGLPAHPVAWGGQTYVHWKGRNVGVLAQHWLPPLMHLRSSGLDIEGWTDWRDGALKEVLGRARLAGLQASVDPPEGQASRTLRTDQMSGVLRWRPTHRGWRLDATSLTLVREWRRRPPADLSIRLEAGAGGRTLAGAVSAFDLADGGALLDLFPGTGPTLTHWLRAARAEGAVRDLRLRVAFPAEGPVRWAASGRILGLGFAPSGHVPGLGGISAVFSADDAGGTARIQSRALSFTLPHLFRQPIRADQVEGEAHWQRVDDGGWRIEAPDLLAENRDISTRSRLAVDLPAGLGSPFIDLQTDFWNGDAAAVPHYLPAGALKPALVSWLDRSLVSGRVPSGTMLFRGTADDFPFRRNEGRFEAVFGVEDGILDYEPDWPRLEEIAGEVRFENHGFETRVASARFLESEVLDAHARVADLFDAAAVRIEGSVEGPLTDGLRTLRETPLKAKFAPLAEGLRAKGSSRADLDMSIPLRPAVQLAIKGRLSFLAPALLAFPDWDLRLSDLTGSLSFTEAALSADDLSARLWDVPLRIRVETPPGGGGDLTRIRVEAPLGTSLLAQRLPSPLWDLADGTTRWDLALDFRSADLARRPLPLAFTLTSGMEGLAIALPKPLGKPAPSSLPLRLKGRLAKGEDVVVQGAYGELGFNLAFKRDSAGDLRFARGALDLSGDVRRLPEAGGLELSGSLRTLDLGPWLAVWAGHGKNGSDPGLPGIPLRGGDFRVEQLRWGDLACNGLQLNLRRGPDRWEVGLDGDGISGDLRIPDRPRSSPLQVRLERLDLESLVGPKRTAPNSTSMKAEQLRLDPQKADILDLTVERLAWGGSLLGSLVLRTDPRPDGLRLTEVSLAGPLMNIRGTGTWTGTDSEQHSALSLAATTNDLGAFLRALELESVLYKAPAKATLDLRWDGGPFQFGLARLRGRLDADVGAGRLLDVEPGLGRVFGVLNLGALRRRLALDFSDIFRQGYGFESIKGAMTFSNGKAVIDRLAIKGPVARIDVSGSANLAAERFDQVVTVTPRIGPGVVVASAVAGGPLVGAAVFLADRASGGAVDKLARYQYRITGPWNKPDIQRLGLAPSNGFKSGASTSGPADQRATSAGSTLTRGGGRPQEPDTPKGVFLEGN